VTEMLTVRGRQIAWRWALGGVASDSRSRPWCSRPVMHCARTTGWCSLRAPRSRCGCRTVARPRRGNRRAVASIGLSRRRRPGSGHPLRPDDAGGKPPRRIRPWPACGMCCSWSTW
jgi:hypothetical protein